MIKIYRGREPHGLRAIRSQELANLRALGRPITSDDISTKYKTVGEKLWRAQYFKCCYCEMKVPRKFNDVEHFRPKGSADRRPGCTETHGYWWLAFTWGNLLFACPSCNRSAKNDKFPLEVGSVSLQPENSVPGHERPLLIDPSAINPVEHIQFVSVCIGLKSNICKWWARPRNGSIIGNKTIEVCELNRDEFIDLRADHFKTTIEPRIKALDSALTNQDMLSVIREFDSALYLLEPLHSYVGFNYDALRAFIDDARLMTAIGKHWPSPKSIGVKHLKNHLTVTI